VFISKNPILKHILYLFIFIVLTLLLVLLWLRFYTNHGQKKELPNFIDKNIFEAKHLAKDNSFSILVTDSVFVVGKKGGIILDQNPKPKSEVKEGRKVYVIISKFDPDKITVGDLPLLYGNDFSQKSVELKHKGIYTKIKSKKYDAGDPNHILEVYYKNELIIDQNTLKSNIKINKGDILEIIVSDREGGEITIPDLICSTYDQAYFLLSENRLNIGELILKGNITDTLDAYILDQNPKYDGITKIPMNSKISLTLVNYKPSKCN
jgi:D-alanine-D-alanine ligase